MDGVDVAVDVANVELDGRTFNNISAPIEDGITSSTACTRALQTPSKIADKCPVHVTTQSHVKGYRARPVERKTTIDGNDGARNAYCCLERVSLVVRCLGWPYPVLFWSPW